MKFISRLGMPGIEKCYISVDGTDLLIFEPRPFGPSFYSHELHNAGLRYEIGVCIARDYIVWLHGPFPCGRFPDLNIYIDWA